MPNENTMKQNYFPDKALQCLKAQFLHLPAMNMLANECWQPCQSAMWQHTCEAKRGIKKVLR